MDTIVYDAVQDVKAVAEYNGGGIEALLNGRTIKHAQRGVANFVGADVIPKGGTKYINISSVDVSKSLCVIDTGRISYYENTALTYALESNRIVVSNPRTDGSNVAAYISWQVIEFY